MRADLHIHTYYSDGAHSPAAVAEMARRAGVELVSFTDHDNMEGMEEKRAAARACGLFFVPGWEISSYTDVKVHVLGYRCERNGAYEAFLAARREGAVKRAEDSVQKANAALGLSLTLDDALAEQREKSAPLHTMHVVRAFARRTGADVRRLYEELFTRGRPAYSDLGRPTPAEAVEAIHACGGLAFLAHPGCIRLPAAERDALLEGLVRRGLDGIECIHTLHTESEREYFLRYAARHGLLVSGGSDFHAEGAGRTLGLPVFSADSALLNALAPL